ncbi:MAG TPA: hypothetical protein QGG18_04170, partial [Rhodospirillales bacterium]|nr:hypothetical protein [Rhodospirillales bacterium]
MPRDGKNSSKILSKICDDFETRVRISGAGHQELACSLLGYSRKKEIPVRKPTEVNNYCARITAPFRIP